jgi:hypothetical protein
VVASSPADDQRVLLRASKLFHHVLACQRLPHRPETLPGTRAAPDAGLRCTSRHARCCAPVRAHPCFAYSRCIACRPRNGRCRRSARVDCSGLRSTLKSPIQNSTSPVRYILMAVWRRTPTRDGTKIMNRGRGRRASSLVPGNGGAPAPALARGPVHGGPAGLRDELDDMLGRIRSTRHISNPLFKCPACGNIGRGADPHISVRATILALACFGVAAREPARALEKDWTTYRKTAGLDLYGHAATSEPARLRRCAHTDER